MAIEALRFAPWHDRKHLSVSQYESLTTAVSKVLRHAVTIHDTNFDVVWVRSFVRSYVQDDALHALESLGQDGTNVPKLSPHEFSIRKSTLQLAERLARIPGGLDVTIIVDLAVAYAARNGETLSTIVEEACKSTPSLLENVMADVVPAFDTTLQAVHGRSSSPICRVTHVLSHLLRCGSSIVMPFARNKEFVLTVAKCYQVGVEKLGTTRGGMGFHAGPNFSEAAGWQRDWLYAKTNLIDSFHAMVQTLLQSQQPNDKDRLLDRLFEILALPSSSTSDQVPPVPFISQSLLADYQYAFDLSNGLNEGFRDIDDPRVDLLAATLVELSSSPHGPKPAGVLSSLIKNCAPQPIAPSSAAKGKAKATNQDSDEEARFDCAISQVLDIFPIHTPQYIQRCLEHPAFDGDSEKLISSLLEGGLPPELVDDMDDTENFQEELPQADDDTFTKGRLNAWDGDPMDVSRLRIGKIHGNADDVLQDRSFIDQMKADIIRRVEELSDEEGDLADRPREVIVAFEEDSDESGALVDKGVKVRGDGEASDETDGEDETDDVTGLPASSPETILELAYMDDPKLFNRDAATRRSKSRAELKMKTGWGDEQIEGWKIMLERNPKKKQTILQKHEFSGNTPLPPDSKTIESGPSGSPSNATHPEQGRGRGRGGSRASGGDTARDRALKDRNKAKNANHNRKRGHDKKMARGGVPTS